MTFSQSTAPLPPSFHCSTSCSRRWCRRSRQALETEEPPWPSYTAKNWYESTFARETASFMFLRRPMTEIEP
ncbi:hypothetical protein Pyn_28144 [Prunus yedoensis var. nudiflora]|uniref:Uncharacterized protein n=1 Tax=Prunus yedoensis var. nudiflora TaxID=2094558 RepID=A0A314ZIW3_PRUYE|nr:hypothetical protein Pyn_28144 [Prunus yedoensis var. nudiflora]